ncbi:MAG: hypothetical protein ACFE7S_06185 [Candidatus Hodarchaeota archaeon]
MPGESDDSAYNVAKDVFPDKRQKKAYNALVIFLRWMKEQKLFASKWQVSKFASGLASEKFLWKNQAFKYSRRNFYGTVMRRLLDLGYLRWGQKYEPGKPPRSGYFLDPDELKRNLMKIVNRLQKFISITSGNLRPGRRR